MTLASSFLKGVPMIWTKTDEATASSASIVATAMDSYDIQNYHHSLCRERTFDGEIALARSLYRTSTSYEAHMRRIKKKEASVRRLQFSNNAVIAPETSLRHLQLSDDITSSPKTSVRRLPMYNIYHHGQMAQKAEPLPLGNSRLSSINTLSTDIECSNTTTTPTGKPTLEPHKHHEHEHIESSVEQKAQQNIKLSHHSFTESSPERDIGQERSSSSNSSSIIPQVSQVQLAQTTNPDKFLQTKTSSLPIIVNPQTSKSIAVQNSVDVDGHLIQNWGYRSPCGTGSYSSDTDDDYMREMYGGFVIA